MQQDNILSELQRIRTHYKENKEYSCNKCELFREVGILKFHTYVYVSVKIICSSKIISSKNKDHTTQRPSLY